MLISILPDIDMSGPIKFCFKVWNTLMKSVYAILTESPSEFKGGEIWKAVKEINPYFVTVGTVLVTLFFMIGLFKEQTDLRREMNPEMAIKLFARLSVAEWLLANTFYIIDAIFGVATWLIGKIITKGVTKMALSKSELKLFEEVDPLSAAVLFFFGLICFVAVIVMAGVMIYTVYSRFFKVYISAPFSAIAVAGVAGGGLGYMARSNLQNIAAYALEGVAIAVTLIVCGKFIGSGIDLGLKVGDSDMLKGLVILTEKTFSVALTVGLTKGGETLVRKNLGF